MIIFTVPLLPVLSPTIPPAFAEILPEDEQFLIDNVFEFFAASAPTIPPDLFDIKPSDEQDSMKPYASFLHTQPCSDANVELSTII